MLIYEYRCTECSSVFEFSSSPAVACVSCECKSVKRVNEMIFSPNKNFCSKYKGKKKKDVRSKLLDLLGESELKCYHTCK